MSEDTELLTGRAGTEAAQGFVDMPTAPAEKAADDSSPLDDDRLRQHFSRPAEDDFGGPITERSYVSDDGSGKPRPDNETVPIRKASEDLASIRAEESAAYEAERNAALANALDAMKIAAGEPVGSPEDQAAYERSLQQTQQPSEAQPEQPQPETVPPGVDPDIAQALQNPKVRGLLEQTAAHYQQATAELATQAQGIMTALFPELANLNGQQTEGALKFMAQSNPQRFEQWKQLAGRAQQLVGVYKQQVAEQQAQQQQRAAHELEQFRVSEVKRFEAATANIPPETLRNISDNVMPTVEKFYGIKEANMRDLISGRQKVDSQTFMHSMPFQLMLLDAVRFRMSQESLSRAATRPVPQVQRPGISEGAKSDDGEVAALWSKLSKNNQGLPGVRAAAELVAARRRARG